MREYTHAVMCEICEDEMRKYNEHLNTHYIENLDTLKHDIKNQIMQRLYQEFHYDCSFLIRITDNTEFGNFGGMVVNSITLNIKEMRSASSFMMRMIIPNFNPQINYEYIRNDEYDRDYVEDFNERLVDNVIEI